VLAGNSALETVRLSSAWLGESEYQVFDAGKSVRDGFVGQPR